MEYVTTRPHRPEGQPPVPGHDELRPADHRSRQLRHHGPGAGAGHQLLRHRQRLRLEDAARASPSRSSAAGSRRAAAGARRSSWRPRSTASMGDWPERAAALGLPHPRGLRGAACAACRPTTSTSTRCTTSTATRPWEEIWQAMETAGAAGQGDLRRQQQLRRLAHRPGAGRGRAARTSWAWSREQSLYNLNARTIELEVIPACRAYGLGVIPWSPLGGGLLGGVLQKVSRGPARGRSASRRPSRRTAPQLEAYEAFCAELGEQPADVALAWLLHNPVVTAPIIGPRTIEQLDGSLRALEIKLSDEPLQAARRDLARPGRRGARSLRLVGPRAGFKG